MNQQAAFQVASGAPTHYERHVAPIMAPFVDAVVAAGLDDLVDDAGGAAGDVGAGDIGTEVSTDIGGDRRHAAPATDGDGRRDVVTVLDLASGTGFVTRAAAQRLGDAGWVVGADLNPAMLAAAREASAALGPRARWCRAAADRLPFRDGRFDAVVCQQGVQFFPDLPAAAAEAARVVRPGGRVAATAWAPIDESPYFVAQGQAITQVLGVDDLESFSQAFACSADAVCEAFHSADLRDVTATHVVADVHLPSPLVDFAVGQMQALPWCADLAAARPDGVRVAGEIIAEVLAERTAPDGSVTLPFASWMVVATR